MYNDQELEKMLKDLESDLVERKESITQGEKIKRMICALANDLPQHGKPGVIFIGAKDDGSCANLKITDDLMQKVAQYRLEGNILPVPNMLLEKKIINNCEMLLVFVHPSDYPPVSYKRQTWIRTGSVLALATREEETRLAERRRSKDIPFDYRAVDGANLDDLDIEFFEQTYLPIAISPEILERNQRSLEHQLRALRMLSNEGIPTYGAILTLGKASLNFIPGAFIQFLRIEGTRLTDPIKDQKTLSGPLFQILPELDDLLKINISIRVDPVTGPRELNYPDYPIAALLQLVRNAIMHRNYESSNAPIRIHWFSDHIEILNPGGLYGQVNEANFGTGVTDYRNPLLAETLRVMGYVQRYGMGIPLAKQELAKNNNPEPEFIIDRSNFLVKIRSRS
jgi:ATP-dependent DNA helicase RecG